MQADCDGSFCSGHVDNLTLYIQVKVTEMHVKNAGLFMPIQDYLALIMD
jgi:hypothetical protein